MSVVVAVTELSALPAARPGPKVAQAVRPGPSLDPGPVLIRELTPWDRHALRFAFAHLGEQSRYQRFLTTKDVLSTRELDNLMAVDHWHHEAMIAFATLPRVPIGIAQYVREREFDTAELAIAVADEWQRRGVGRSLAAAVTDRAVRAGIRRLTATVLRGNRGALALAREVGRCSVTRAGGASMELLIELQEVTAPASRSSTWP